MATIAGRGGRNEADELSRKCVPRVEFYLDRPLPRPAVVMPKGADGKFIGREALISIFAGQVLAVAAQKGNVRHNPR